MIYLINEDITDPSDAESHSRVAVVLEGPANPETFLREYKTTWKRQVNQVEYQRWSSLPPGPEKKKGYANLAPLTADFFAEWLCKAKGFTRMAFEEMATHL